MMTQPLCLVFKPTKKDVLKRLILNFMMVHLCGIFYVPLCQQQKRKLRLYISNTFNPARPDADDSDGSIASWELRVEGKLLDDVSCFRVKYSAHSHGVTYSIWRNKICSCDAPVGCDKFTVTEIIIFTFIYKKVCSCGSFFGSSYTP